jgi:hypothetical protein
MQKLVVALLLVRVLTLEAAAMQPVLDRSGRSAERRRRYPRGKVQKQETAIRDRTMKADAAAITTGGVVACVDDSQVPLWLGALKASTPPFRKQK